ncbi:MAG TPA: hypothetical protein VLL27_13880, partial [Solirubrobacterales bacterium]|nr:hypothetical protein [Solirubrobacterales bacterium]
MIGRKAVIGLTVLCALLVSAFAAQAASAVGTTAYTCKGVTAGTGTFKAGHCKPGDAGTGNFSHVSIANGTSTEITGSDLNTAGEHTGAILKSTVSGSAVELVAKEISGTGTMSNSLNGAEMVASGEGAIKYSGVTEKLLGCKVTGKPGGAGVVETKQLFATTKEVGDKLKFTPKEGTVFAEFELTECAVGPTTVKVVGSVLGVPDGATTNTT